MLKYHIFITNQIIFASIRIVYIFLIF